MPVCRACHLFPGHRTPHLPGVEQVEIARADDAQRRLRRSSMRYTGLPRVNSRPSPGIGAVEQHTIARPFPFTRRGSASSDQGDSCSYDRFERAYGGTAARGEFVAAGLIDLEQADRDLVHALPAERIVRYTFTCMSARRGHGKGFHPDIRSIALCIDRGRHPDLHLRGSVARATDVPSPCRAVPRRDRDGITAAPASARARQSGNSTTSSAPRARRARTA